MEHLATKSDVEKAEQLMGDFWMVVRKELHEAIEATEKRILTEVSEYKSIINEFFDFVKITLREHSDELKEHRDEIKQLRKELSSLKKKVK